ncbi:MAG: hypothetical protein AAB065_02380 [Deltaproteobacteria bacterium]
MSEGTKVLSDIRVAASAYLSLRIIFASAAATASSLRFLKAVRNTGAVLKTSFPRSMPNPAKRPPAQENASGTSGTAAAARDRTVSFRRVPRRTKAGLSLETTASFSAPSWKPLKYAITP